VVATNSTIQGAYFGGVFTFAVIENYDRNMPKKYDGRIAEPNSGTFSAAPH
jgi:hypothetical protein